MRIVSNAIIGLSFLAAAPAFAWSDAPSGRPEFQPASNQMAIWAYPTEANYCPPGLQPVVLGGVICCGVPTHTGYRSHVVQHRAPAPAPVYQGAKDGFISYSKDYAGN